MKINKKILSTMMILNLTIFATSTLGSNIKCSLSYDLMEVIAKVEGSPKRDVGYPFIISFNNPVKYKKVLKGMNFKSINNRTLDCKSKNNCVSILSELEKKGIKNLDLGAFQMNYIYHNWLIIMNLPPCDVWDTKLSLMIWRRQLKI